VSNAFGFGILMLFAVTYCVAAIAWSVAAFYLFKTIANRQPGVRLWSAHLGYIPLNAIFRPDLLTSRGRLCRRRFGLSLLVFVGALGAGLALGALVHLLR
jgi:hypothetical protein